jgi:hypothetical protein
MHHYDCDFFHCKAPYEVLFCPSVDEWSLSLCSECPYSVPKSLDELRWVPKRNIQPFLNQLSGQVN